MTLSHSALVAKATKPAKRARPPKATDADGLLLAALLVESSDDAIIGMTGQSLITTWNRSAERLYGYPVGIRSRHRDTDGGPDSEEPAPSEVSALEKAGVTAVLPKEAGATQAAVSLITEALVTKAKGA